MRHENPRTGARAVLVLLALVLGTGALAGPAGSATPVPTDDRVDNTVEKLQQEPTRERARRATPDFKIAQLNLHNSMSTDGMRHDIRKMIGSGATVIGMQERRGTRPMVRRALPDHWRLAMPTTRDGSDDNPIAWNTRVWRLRNSWAHLLTGNTWYRDGYGNQAVDQYAVVAVLQHRTSGHTIRVASLHMPNDIQTQEGGPRWSERDNLEAFWRMARSLRGLARRTPDRLQFVTTCDCNVSWGRDHTRHLLKGKVTRPLELMSNYSEGGKRTGWQIDYVLAERREPYVIETWSVHHDLRTDHPGVLTRFGHR
ncbi:MAG TPA: hypothetical protein VF728_07710 [Nocardioides sp.]